MIKYKYQCSNCGSENVRRDAWAAWDADSQTWELAVVFDAGYCDDCGDATVNKAVEMADEKHGQPRSDRLSR